ncbi:hypothetical protein [Arthrobacter sp. GMC3]|uniref:hypothetical protein n=1 Tax=Arthrobacter sp. GMC3 TaxID=2058894 RepID=UPI000CE395C8|nr:hypothetical protein [Arthrobacter sp. GMC3]
MIEKTNRLVQLGKRKMTQTQKVMAVISLVGAVIAIPATFFLVWGLREWFSRMDCTADTWWGNGCYEGELEITLFAFGVLYLPFFIPSLTVALRHRKNGLATSWAFLVLCAVPVAILLLSIRFWATSNSS